MSDDSLKEQTPYTPSMDEVRQAFVTAHSTPPTSTSRQAYLGSLAGPEFDRALAAHEQKVRVATLREAADLCQRIQDDPEFPESGVGVRTARIVLTSRADAILNDTPKEPNHE